MNLSILTFSTNFCLVTLFDFTKLTILKIFMNFCPFASLAMLNETFSVIFKHRVQVKVEKVVALP